MFCMRSKAGLVLGAFSAALTVLPWLHTLNHRDDHVHVDGAIVFVGEHDGGHAHDHDADHEDEEEDATGPPGFDHPAHHGRGALAHGSAFILAATVFLFPAPAVALEPAPEPAPPERPPLAEQRSPRMTRGPPLAA